MDREKVIKGFECCSGAGGQCIYCPYDNGSIEEADCRKDLDHDAIELLKEQEWISVKERLPKSMANKVLVYLQHDELVSYIGYGHYEKFKGEEMWYDLENNEQFSERGYTVTHWMPLPESPNGERLTLS